MSTGSSHRPPAQLFETPLLQRVYTMIREEIDPEFELVRARPIPWTAPPGPISSLRVALITTGGLHREGEPAFKVLESRLGDPGFRVVPHHLPSRQLDLSAVYVEQRYTPKDPEVALPRRALDRLVERQIVGGAAPRHLSFCGGLVRPMPGLITSASEAIDILRADRVDAVLLIPTCSLCVQTVCILACELEAAGIVTATLSLIEELSRVVGAPRALVVRFPFGAPCGDPGNQELHDAVVEEALDLLSTSTRPGTISSSSLAWRRQPAST